MSKSRRLRTWLASAVFGGILAAQGVASAAIDCRPGPAGERCIAGVRYEVANKFANVQRRSEWCWAASISMVFGYYGLDIDQAEIVRAAWGEVVNMPGTPQAIAASLNRVWTDSHGRRWQVTSTLINDPAAAAEALAADRPLIIGTQGHAMVLTAMEFDRGGAGDGAVRSALVRDPWPGNGRRALSAEEWYATNLLVQVEVTPLDGDGKPGAGWTAARTATHGWSGSQ